MRIFICYSTVNIPGHGIQSLSLSTEKVEDMNAQSWHAKWGWWEVKVLVSSFVTSQMQALFTMSILPYGINLMQWFSSVYCKPFKIHTSIWPDCLHSTAYPYLSMATYFLIQLCMGSMTQIFFFLLLALCAFSYMLLSVLCPYCFSISIVDRVFLQEWLH